MTDVPAFDLIAAIVTLAALFGYLNHRILRLPHTIGLVVIALVASLVIIGLDRVIPFFSIDEWVRDAIIEVDFAATLLNGLLAFLLFAGALHTDLDDLVEERWPVLAMATFGVLISAAIVGFSIWYLSGLVGIDLPLIVCLTFGVLISPTDPVAVISILKTLDVPPRLTAMITGESLFNDGVGVAIFTVFAAAAATAGTAGGGESLDFGELGILFVQEAVGGAVLGLVLGYAAYRALRTIDEYNLEVLITLSLVFLTATIAHAIHVSGPIAVVIAGLLIGNHGMRFAMSETTWTHVNKFWSLIDEVLNSFLFLVIGFEVVAITFDASLALLAVLAIPVSLVARFVAVWTPLSLMKFRLKFPEGTVRVLTWGGLRGGIAVALALSLPAEVPGREAVLAITYAVVIFSIIVQGSTVERVIARVMGDHTGDTEAGRRRRVEEGRGH